MNSIGGDVDEFSYDAAATGSHVAFKNKLDIGKSSRNRINGLTGQNQDNQKSDILSDHGRSAPHQKIADAPNTHA